MAFNLDLLRRGREDSPTSPQVLLWMAVIASVVGPVWLMLYLRKLSYLYTHGHQTRGRVETISMLQRAGRSPTTVVFVVDGTEHRIKKDMLRSEVAVGGEVDVLYDPSNPKRAKIFKI